jgi:hypothetical protein
MLGAESEASRRSAAELLEQAGQSKVAAGMRGG